MRPTRHRTALLAILLVAVACLASCREGDALGEGEIPLKGEVTYDVTYSDDLRQISTIGSFLPRSLHGIYDTCNVKLSAHAPLGLANMDIVLSEKENYATIDFDKAKLLVKLGELVPTDMTQDLAGRTKISISPNATDISGYMSNCVVLEPEIASDIDERIEVFFVPFPNSISNKDLMTKAIEAQNLNRLGLVTAVNITYGESNVIMMLKEVKANDDVEPDDFDRPTGYIEASRVDIQAMMDLMIN